VLVKKRTEEVDMDSGENELFESMRKVANWFNWDLTKREDPDREDVSSGNVWPDELAERAVDAALEAGPPKVFFDFRARR